MLRLITFGGLSLLHDGVVLKTHRPRQRLLPMLAILATEDGYGMPRGRLAELLWPDSDPRLARHSLEEVVSQARKLARLAGSAELFADEPALRLDRRAIAVDVWDFDAALAASELERAVLICNGRRFAAEVSLEGCDDVDRRLAATGVRYVQAQREALDGLVRRAQARADGDAVLRWMQRIVDLDPEDRRAALALVDALVAQREPIRAIAAAEAYQRYLQTQELTPDAEMAERVRQLRAGRTPEPAEQTSGNPVAFRVLRAAPRAPEAVEQRDRARIERAIAPRWRITGPADRGSVVTSYTAQETGARGARADVHVLGASIASQAQPERFTRVLQRVAGLQHACILPTLEYGVDEELFYFVTAPRAAGALRSRLAREQQLPIRDAVVIARHVADALAHAHERGVMHGDLRPKHVHLPTPRDVVVGFFGVVGAVASESRSGEQPSYVVSFGERAYQSPEQLRQGMGTSPQSDVYAVGAMLYQMLAGDPPFAVGGEVDVGAKLTGAPMGLRTRRDSVPEGLERVVRTCLARVPADRFASGVELAAALAAPEQLDAPAVAP